MTDAQVKRILKDLDLEIRGDKVYDLLTRKNIGKHTFRTPNRQNPLFFQVLLASSMFTGQILVHVLLSQHSQCNLSVRTYIFYYCADVAIPVSDLHQVYVFE